MHRSDRSLLRGAGGSGVISASLVGLTAATTLLLTRILGPTGYGAYAYALSWSLLLASPALIGLPPLVIRQVAAYHALEQWPPLRGIIRRANQVAISTSLAICIVGALVGWLLRAEPDLLYPYLAALPLVPLIAVTSLRTAVLQGFGRVVLARTPEPLHLVVFIALVGATYAAIGAELGATLAVLLNVAAAALVLPLGIMFQLRSTPAAVREAEPAYEMRSWARSLAPLIVMSAILPFSGEIGIILLGQLKGPDDVGIFSVARRAAGLVSFLLLATTYSILPTVARLHALRDHEGLQRALTRSARAVTLASLPIALGLALFSDAVLSLFGPGFSDGTAALRIMIVGEFINVASGFAGSALVMTGQERKMLRGTAIGASIFLVLSVALIPRYGTTGVAVATAVSLASTQLLFAYYLWRREGLISLAFTLPRLRP